MISCPRCGKLFPTNRQRSAHSPASCDQELGLRRCQEEQLILVSGDIQLTFERLGIPRVYVPTTHPGTKRRQTAPAIPQWCVTLLEALVGQDNSYLYWQDLLNGTVPKCLADESFRLATTTICTLQPKGLIEWLAAHGIVPQEEQLELTEQAKFDLALEHAKDFR